MKRLQKILVLGLTVISKDFKVLYANKVILDACGDVIGKKCYTALHHRKSVCSNCGVKEIFETGKDQITHNQVILGPTGNYTHLDITATSIRNENGEIISATEIALDITERKKAEDSLIESEEKFSTIVNSINDAIALIDPKGNITYCNNAFQKIFGYSKKEITRKKIFSIVPPDVLPQARPRVQKFENTGNIPEGKPFFTVGLTKDHKRVPIELSLKTITVGSNVYAVGILKDVTENKKVEHELKNSEEKYRKLFEEALDAIFLADAKTGIIVDCNRAATKLVGRTKSELIGKTQRILHPTEECTKGVTPGFKKHCDEKIKSIDKTQIITKKGQIKDVLIKASEFTVNNKRILQGTFRDITDRKNAEIAVDNMVNELERVIEKLRVVGKATRHDARNKLSVIANNVYLANQSLTTNHSASKYLDSIELAISQITDIFGFARIYEMIGVEDRSYVDVEKIVNEAVILFSGLGDTKLENECCGLTVMADSQLLQFFYNLIDNSMKHGKKVTKIRVHYKENDDMLQLIYEDNGIGIPEAEKELIFNEGYGKCTGYGLYLIQKICESYGWSIKETGTPGKGAQFTIIVHKKNKN
ncbi:MAG: PAS domain-containing sensor histidine kinase [Candidatus Bathyarchaeota archaeon]|nr:PAS domain-containing sensor histidine kinase [Candidatus Bathyarchaeum sp.]